ncbi:hypothetical protein JIN84_02625 [Luteolibacter yonseiensis]|uniref:Uncharacterized protein n=1 Tax=Luteolibacter yonseiensis TaxID=1144680 RepID=A0A934VA48_9BACT|nr:hypothetical protein [Luteolibacter yonseiensis]MBK1814491.1 hypothetical protein [Luteolibacter yonseiensis]
MHKSFLSARVSVLLLLGATGLTAAGTGPFSSQAQSPTADLWMYPNANNLGGGGTASTFTALPTVYSPPEEDRLAQFVVRFNTVAAGIPAGLGVDNYDVSRIALTCILTAGGIRYDATEDPRSSYGPGSTADPDAGRPLEVYGTGFRNNFTAATFTESSAFGPKTAGGRNAYAMSYTPAGVARDVSNNVTGGFDSMPWAIGKIQTRPFNGGAWTQLAPGAMVPDDPNLLIAAVFELNTTLPGVANYVKTSLNQGYIWLTVSSLHSTEQQAFSGFPQFYTKENAEHALFGFMAPSLNVTYSLPVKVITFSRNETAQTASITWNGSPGYKYTVERSETMAVGSWTPVHSVTPTSAGNLNWSGSSPSPKSFYRISRIVKP